MIGFYILVSLIGVVCILVPVPTLQPPRKRLPLPTREHEPRLLALVERIEAADRRVEAGCGLEQCSVHDLAVWCHEERKALFHRMTARAHELGIEIDKYSRSRNP